MFSRINLLLLVSIKEIRFGFEEELFYEGTRDGWRQIDDALCDPKLKSLRLVGVSHYDEELPFPLDFMPKSNERGILRYDGDDQHK